MTTENIAFVFPGQNSQEVGMGKALAENFALARDIFNEADQVLGFPLSRLCFEGPESALNDTINTQVAIFTTSIAALKSLEAAGFTTRPKYMAGHSLGEYTAYVAAGVISFEDGLRLVRERGRLMKKAGEINPGGMAAILKLDDNTVEDICRQVTAEVDGTLQLANYNAPGQLVISGHDAAIDKGIELAVAAKARRAVKLSVSIAAHSELMRVIVDEFRAAVENTPLNLPETPIVANISAKPLNSLVDIQEEMAGQLTSPVRWTDSIQWMIDQGVGTFVEIGPKSVLSGMIRWINKGVNRHNVGTPEDIRAILDADL